MSCGNSGKDGKDGKNGANGSTIPVNSQQTFVFDKNLFAKVGEDYRFIHDGPVDPKAVVWFVWRDKVEEAGEVKIKADLDNNIFLYKGANEEKETIKNNGDFDVVDNGFTCEYNNNKEGGHNIPYRLTREEKEEVGLVLNAKYNEKQKSMVFTLSRPEIKVEYKKVGTHPEKASKVCSVTYQINIDKARNYLNKFVSYRVVESY